MEQSCVWKNVYYEVFNSDHSQKVCGRQKVSELIAALDAAFPNEKGTFGDAIEGKMNVGRVQEIGKRYCSSEKFRAHCGEFVPMSEVNLDGKTVKRYAAYVEDEV